MSESSSDRTGADCAHDWVDEFALSWFLSSMVENVPHVRLSTVEFSLGGVLWKTVLYGLAYVAGFACGWLVLTDDSQDRVRAWIADSGFLAVLSGLAVANLLGRYEDGKARPGSWFVVLSFLFASGFGVVFGAAGRTSGGVFRWVPVSVAVLVVVGVLVFPLVMRLARNGFVSWAAVVVLCVVPSWMRAKATVSAGVSFSGAAWRVLSAPCGSCWACGRSGSARARIVMRLSSGWRLGRWCAI